VRQCPPPSSSPEAPSPGRLSAAGFSLIELLVVVAVIAIVAGIAIPAVLQARLSANESAAISSLTVIRSAQVSFAGSCGGGGFAQSLDDLAKPPNGSTESFLSEPFAANGVLRSGYFANVLPDTGALMVKAAADTCNSSAAPSMSSYFAERHAQTIGMSGQRSFAMATNGPIFARDDGVTITPGMAGAYTLR
jgi:prepilin-type N-terminal cleavage/methylation domain-containing protein